MFSGRGGLIPSLATNNFNNFAVAKNIQKSSREQICVHQFTLRPLSGRSV